MANGILSCSFDCMEQMVVHSWTLENTLSHVLLIAYTSPHKVDHTVLPCTMMHKQSRTTASVCD